MKYVVIITMTLLERHKHTGSQYKPQPSQWTRNLQVSHRWKIFLREDYRSLRHRPAGENQEGFTVKGNLRKKANVLVWKRDENRKTEEGN